VFGEFSFPGDAALAPILRLYAVGAPDAPADATLAAYIARRLPQRPEVGDRVPLGGIELVVRTLGDDGRIGQVGIELEPEPGDAPRWPVRARRALSTVTAKIAPGRAPRSP
jgi:cell volume regulation protein A